MSRQARKRNPKKHELDREAKGLTAADRRGGASKSCAPRESLGTSNWKHDQKLCKYFCEDAIKRQCPSVQQMGIWAETRAGRTGGVQCTADWEPVRNHALSTMHRF